MEHHRRRHHRRDARTRFDVFEVAPRQRQRVSGVDVAGDGQRRVRRMVVGAEEMADFIELGGIEVGDLANRRPVVRMVRRKQRRQHRHRREAVRAVFVVLAPFVQHDITLIGELGVGQSRQQKSHPIGFHPQREFERVRRHHLPVVGPVGIGRSVQRRAGALQGRKIPAVVMLRSFEHQMLEQMREPGVTGRFVFGTDVVPEIHRDDRTGPIFVQQHVQAVGQCVLAESDVHRTSVIGMGLA